MCAKFNPADTSLWPEAWYDAAIVNAKDGIGKTSGNAYLVATFECYGPMGNIRIDRYFVLENKGGKTGLKKLCMAIGLLERFQQGEINPEELIGKSLKVLVKVQESDDPRWDDKNVVSAFALATSSPEAAFPKQGIPDDDIPF